MYPSVPAGSGGMRPPGSEEEIPAVHVTNSYKTRAVRAVGVGIAVAVTARPMPWSVDANSSGNTLAIAFLSRVEVGTFLLLNAQWNR
ncbi:hypothetical protein FHETE_11306 [Fusarium heterosporum]|uniref:Uncharacterized protein n=1 Tax=Fusarium heterosporum TaxID=42747 RepID=A0A8H5WC27_FUSHE|nr:hypothetical protein FHETE_11306 [Fusarium heterosporum]